MTNEPVDYAWVKREAERLSNWGRWGPDDQIGALNLITPEKIVEAARCVRKGKVFSLSLPFDLNGPMNGAYGRFNPMHFMTEDGGDIVIGAQDHLENLQWTDDWVVMSLSCSTQWDGLPHVFVDGHMYNGVPASAVNSHGATKNSIDRAKDKIVSRGVLLDIARHHGVDWLEPGHPINADDLEACRERQGVALGPGDIVLIRTGQLNQVRTEGAWGDFAGGASPGLAVRTADWFADYDIAAYATDTWGTEVIPYEATDTLGPLHKILLTHRGMLIGEMFDLEDLADDCAEDGIYEHMLIAPPLCITGASNTPVNPQAIK